MSQLQIALFLTTALDIAAVYTAAIAWLRTLNKEPAMAITTCDPEKLGSPSKRPY
jgi:hypothetical protein